MAIAVQMDFPGGTLAQYDQVMTKMDLAREGAGVPGGALFHWVTATDNGLRVVDVWETREQFETFARDQILPFTREAGFTETPDVAFYDVHNYLTAA
jgi:hypothetical protein